MSALILSLYSQQKQTHQPSEVNMADVVTLSLELELYASTVAFDPAYLDGVWFAGST